MTQDKLGPNLKSVIVLNSMGTPIALSLLRRDDIRRWRVLPNGQLMPSLLEGDNAAVVNNPDKRLPDEVAVRWGVCEAYGF